MFKKDSGNIRKFNRLENRRELDLANRKVALKEDRLSKWERMERTRQQAFQALQKAHEDGIDYLIIKHGKSPSKRGTVSVGSRIRQLMRSHAAGPYIMRNSCVEHESFFVAAIRKKDTLN